MTSRDERSLLRRRDIEKAQAANKIARAGRQLRKKVVHWWYVRQWRNVSLSFLPASPLLLVSVAFNDPTLIAVQAEAIKRFVSDDSSFIVVDNSPDEEKRMAIRDLSETYGFSYVPAPVNPYSWIDPSISHSLVLDWAWRNIVRKIQPQIVVFLDHDVLPIRPVDLTHLLGAAVASGYRRDSGGRWLLWPGLLAMDYHRLAPFAPCFMPRRDTDSGGSMWWKVYSRIPESEIRFLDREELIFAETSQRAGDGSSGEMHLLDGDWLHLVDGSGWSDGEGKMGKLPLGTKSPNLDNLISFARKLRDRGV